MCVRHALAAALLLTLALASCSGGAPPEAATPEASPVSEATSTPAPTATATPEAASTPEQACANGVAVADPEANPGLVADCEALLRAKDALRGEASLDWGGGLAVADWEGVAVSGKPSRVTSLDLRGKGLTGSIPRALRRLRLGEVRLTGNALTGCVPSAFEDASTHDIASLGLPWCLRYDRLDATGEVAEAGSWAILGGNGEVLTTWEQLRSEAATLRVHQTDAGGASWVSEFGAVAVNDLFEWRMASDCWVRYRVTGAPVAPASGASGRWEFPVEWMTYAATGAGCKGAVGTSTVLSADEAPPSVIRSLDIVTPVRHGAYLLVPPGWANWATTVEQSTWQPSPAAGPSGSSAAAATPSPFLYTTDAAEARRRIPHWREPALPAGWTFGHAESGTDGSPVIGYCAAYRNAGGYIGCWVCARYKPERPQRLATIALGGMEAKDLHVLDEHAAVARYSPEGPLHNQYSSIRVAMFDSETGMEYAIHGRAGVLLGSDTAAALAIARSLLPADTAP